MDKTPNIKSKLLQWRSVGLVLILASIVLLIALTGAIYWTGRQLAAELIKIKQAGEPLSFSDLIGPSLSGEDATNYYYEALSSIGPNSLENAFRANRMYRQSLLSLPANQFPEELRQQVTKNLADFVSVFGKLAQAGQLPLNSFNIGINRGIKVCNADLQRIHSAAFLLSLQTLNLVLQGRCDDAADSTINLLKITRILDFQPITVVHVTKARLITLACEDIRILLQCSQLSDASLGRLHEALALTITPDALERTFLAERVYQTEMARNIIPENITSRLLPITAPASFGHIPKARSLLTKMRIRRASTHYFREMARLIIASRLPWPQPLEEIVPNAPISAGTSNKVTSMAAAVVYLTADSLVTVRSSMLAVAIERYRRSQGRLPNSLDDLSPNYITAIPLDPFTGRKLIYKTDKDGFVVYSVGINRQDDNGSIVPENMAKIPLDRGVRIAFEKSE